MKIVTILGARPQFIKASALSRAIMKNSFLDEVIVHTGQHFDANMSDIFFSELEIPVPRYQLGISGGNHGQMTGRQLEKVEDVLLVEQPDVVVVYGDTNSTLAGALAAAKLNIPVAHIEAGLRSFNRRMPEEINRVMTDHLSNLLFTPTSVAFNNLLREGISEHNIFQVGDIMFDNATYFGNKKYSKALVKGDYFLATIHRAENTNDDSRIKTIFTSLIELAKKHNIVIPLHPRTKNKLIEVNMYDTVKNNLKVIDPVGYLDMVNLEKNSSLIITDSGGVQKEAYFQGVKCVTLRDETEWVELIDTGWNRLVCPLTEENIVKQVGFSLGANVIQQSNLYGAGDTAEQICDILLKR